MDTMEAPGSSSAEVWRIDKANLEVLWPIIADLLEKYPGGFTKYDTVEDIKYSIYEGVLDLWVGLIDNEIKLAGISCFQGSVNKYLLVLWTGGTHFTQLREKALDKLELWGALHGAKEIVFGGRPGWVRRMADLGFNFHRVEVSKPIKYILADGNLTWRQ